MIDKNGNFIPDNLEEKASILWKNKLVIGLCTAIVLLSFQNYYNSRKFCFQILQQ